MGKKSKQPAVVESESPSESEGSEDAEFNHAAMQAQLARMMNPNIHKEFVAGLTAPVRNRVNAIQGLEKDVVTLQEEYQREHKALLEKYDALYQPFLEKRRDIVSGEREPTEEEQAAGANPYPLESYTPGEDAKTEDEGVSGIPRFWARCLAQHSELAELITERDQSAVDCITDISVKNFEDPSLGFTLDFRFKPNDFFHNTLLTKSYHLLPEDDFMLDKAEGCDIRWKDSQNLTKVLRKKKQKLKGGKGTRTVTKEEDCDSFFNFFSPPQFPEDEEDEEDEENEDIEERIEADYEQGMEIKLLVSKAVRFFTGAATEIYSDDEEEEEEEDEDSEGDDDSEPGAKPKKKAKDTAAPAPTGEQPPECKQQ